MNKYKKLIVLLLIIAVGVILFIYPKSFKQTYKDVQVFENGKKVRTVDIKLDGKIHKAHWVWQRLKFSEELNGSITIDVKNTSYIRMIYICFQMKMVTLLIMVFIVFIEQR